MSDQSSAYRPSLFVDSNFVSIISICRVSLWYNFSYRAPTKIGMPSYEMGSSMNQSKSVVQYNDVWVMMCTILLQSSTCRDCWFAYSISDKREGSTSWFKFFLELPDMLSGLNTGISRLLNFSGFLYWHRSSVYETSRLLHYYRDQVLFQMWMVGLCSSECGLPFVHFCLVVMLAEGARCFNLWKYFWFELWIAVLYSTVLWFGCC